LNLPGHEVAHCAEDKIDGVLRLNVVPKQMVQLCPGCDRPCDSWRRKRWLENILDLPLGGRPVCLKVRVFQYQCEHCGRTWTPHSPIVAVIVDHTNRRVLEVLESREKARVKEYLETGRAHGLFAAVEEVTTDMWDGYVEAVKEAFEGEVRVTGRVARPESSTGVDRARSEACQALRKSLTVCQTSGDRG
jgi:transposase